MSKTFLSIASGPGIGLATARRFGREGYRVVLAARNAGFGHQGLIEESSLAEFRRQFEVNVFGAVAMMKAVLPAMRRRRSGHMINITSIGGLTTFPGLGVYHGSKFALEGISEALGKEVASLGIRVTAVEPGAFRTDWAGRSMVRATRSISDYDAVIAPVSEMLERANGNQPGDPSKAAAAILAVVASTNPPAHLLLGSDAWRLGQQKLEALQTEFQTWKDVTLSTDFVS
jgi:NAD(P)-dependent dehydrogenase (short-subunit alcohol dehydrogenase family)